MAWIPLYESACRPLTEILLSVTAASLLTERRIKALGPKHRVASLLEKNNDRFVLLRSVYAPVKHHLRAHLFTKLPQRTADAHIEGGDMNCTMDATFYSHAYTFQSNKGSEQLQTRLSAAQLSEVWRMQHSDARVYTSPSKRHKIDFLFVSKSRTSSTKFSITSAIACSDHQCPKTTIGTAASINKKGH